MNIVKASLLIATISLSGALFAQTNAPAAQQPAAPAAQAQQGLSVSASVKDGVITINVSGNPQQALASNEDVFKEMLKRALEAAGMNTGIARAVEASMNAIKAHLLDGNSTVSGDVQLTVIVNPDINNGVVSTKIEMALDGNKYSSDTKSTFDANGNISTSGNVTVVSKDGKSTTSPAVVTTDANGKITVSSNGATIVAQSEAAQNAQNLSNPNTVPNEVGGGSNAVSGDNGSVIPDNTVVTSDVK